MKSRVLLCLTAIALFTQLPVPVRLAAQSTDSDRTKGFHFLVRLVGPGTDQLILEGNGKFDEYGNVEGGGDFNHYQAVGSPPFPVVSTGTWKARKFVSFTLPTITAPGDPEATSGVFQAGILTLTADFHPFGQQEVKDVVVEVVCNLGPAGASTPDKDEGVYLTLDGVAYEPSVPGLGVTVFTHHEHSRER
jgi:hypothetical protein